MDILGKVLNWVVWGLVVLIILVLIALAVLVLFREDVSSAGLYAEVFWRELKADMVRRGGEFLTTAKESVARGPKIAGQIFSLIFHFLFWPILGCPVPLILIVGTVVLILWFRKRGSRAQQSDAPAKAQPAKRIFAAVILIALALFVIYIVSASAIPLAGGARGILTSFTALLFLVLCPLLALIILSLPFIGVYLLVEGPKKKSTSFDKKDAGVKEWRPWWEK